MISAPFLCRSICSLFGFEDYCEGSEKVAILYEQWDSIKDRMCLLNRFATDNKGWIETYSYEYNSLTDAIKLLYYLKDVYGEFDLLFCARVLDDDDTVFEKDFTGLEEYANAMTEELFRYYGLTYVTSKDRNMEFSLWHVKNEVWIYKEKYTVEELRGVAHGE